MTPTTALGVFREQEHSPERESDDEAILAAVAQELARRHGFDVRTIRPEGVRRIERVPDVIFYMCERRPVLERLERLQKRGALLINSPEGVRATFREAMLQRLADLPFFPDTRLVATNAASNGFRRVWVKRGDYHAIEKRDVQFAETPEDLRRIMADFQRREIARVLVQQHVDGDLIKFYGVRSPRSGSRWFHWFYHRDQHLRRHAFDRGRLQRLCEQAADRMHLEIFGGDAIVTAGGKLFVIDVNAWPSFALFRSTAAQHIADHIAGRVEMQKGSTDV